jgi:Cu+-exporting ATPase
MAIEIDPVCGMSVDTATSQLSLEYEGTTYWFCGKGCLLDFQDDPEAFLGSDATPSMPPSMSDPGVASPQRPKESDAGPR